MRSGDRRWWPAMNELAPHVAEIDIYHTTEDRAAYSGGLFWHTYHYRDAGRATHRCYAIDEGGGRQALERTQLLHGVHVLLLSHRAAVGQSRSAFVGRLGDADGRRSAHSLQDG